MAVDVGTNNENILSRATDSSLYTADVFFDIVNEFVFQDVKKAPAVGAPNFATDTAPVSPAAPSPYQANAIAQMIRNAAETFVNQHFGPETEVSAASAAAREWLVAAADNPDSAEMPEVQGGYLGELMDYFTDASDTHPAYVPDPVADDLDANVEASYVHAKAAVKAQVATDLRAYALGGIVWQDRGVALRAAAGYVAALSDAETESADGDLRIKAAEADMEAGVAKWIRSQIANNVQMTAAIAAADKAVRQDVEEASAMYHEIELRTAAARDGAQQLSRLVAAARNAINGIVAVSKHRVA